MIYFDALVFQAAFWSLMVGLVIGLIRFIWESVYGQVNSGLSYSLVFSSSVAQHVEANAPADCATCCPQTPCGEDSDKPDIISKVHYLHFGIILFVIVAVLCIVISLLTEPIDPKHVSVCNTSPQLMNVLYVLVHVLVQQPYMRLRMNLSEHANDSMSIKNPTRHLCKRL